MRRLIAYILLAFFVCTNSVYKLILLWAGGPSGLEGKVIFYPITKQKLESSYELTGSKYSHSFEYDPSIRNIVTGEKISVLNFANGVISTGKSRILANISIYKGFHDINLS